MESGKGSLRMGLVHRVIALGLAFVTTSIIATSVAVVFTASAGGVTGSIARAAAAPVRLLVGG